MKIGSLISNVDFLKMAWNTFFQTADWINKKLLFIFGSFPQGSLQHFWGLGGDDLNLVINLISKNNLWF